MKLFAIEINVTATAYVKAETEKEAVETAQRFRNKALELPTFNANVVSLPGDVLMSGEPFDSPNLPPLSLSPAMTMHGTNGFVEEVHDYGTT